MKEKKDKGEMGPFQSRLKGSTHVFLQISNKWKADVSWQGLLFKISYGHVAIFIDTPLINEALNDSRLVNGQIYKIAIV